MNHEKARRHADVEPLALGVEPLFGQLARGARRVDAFCVHLDFPGRVANLLNRARLGALQPFRRLDPLETRARLVRLVRTLAEWIRHADADRPRRVVMREQLTDDGPEVRHGAGTDNRSGETAGAKDLRPAQAARLVAR